MDVKRLRNRGVRMEVSQGELGMLQEGLNLLLQDPAATIEDEQVVFDPADVRTVRQDTFYKRTGVPGAQFAGAQYDGYDHRVVLTADEVLVAAGAYAKVQERYKQDFDRDMGQNPDMHTHAMRVEAASWAVAALLPFVAPRP